MNTTNTAPLVFCDAHTPREGRPAPHHESGDCKHAHLVGPYGDIPSMTAVETLDPREARP